MFSGIVHACVPIAGVERKPDLSRIILDLGRLAKGLKRGASVSIGGVCLTVVGINGSKVSFEAMQETLDKTTLGAARKGEKVNIERSIRFGDEIGGHIVSGHVDGTAKITKIEKPENNCIMTFECSSQLIRYMFPKGFVAIDGTSLTLVDVNRKNSSFTIHFIPETLAVTTFGLKKIGDMVNIEVDRLTVAVIETITRKKR